MVKAYTSMGMTFKGCDNGEADIYCPSGVGSTVHGGVTYDCCNSNNCNWRVMTTPATVIIELVSSCYKNIGVDKYVQATCQAPSKFCIVKSSFFFYVKVTESSVNCVLFLTGIHNVRRDYKRL
jgi:hypothetical protein